MLPAALWLTLVGAGAAVSHSVSRVTGEPETSCMFKRATGLPCPTCGGTRCVLSLARGRIVQAVLFNPLVFVGLIVVAAIALIRVVAARRVSVELARRQRIAAWVGGIALALVNWAYLIVAGL